VFILKGILRAESQENILMYLLVREKGYGKAIAEFFDCPPNPIQKQLQKLEEDGVLVSRTIGKLREYELNPRYAFISPLKELLKAGLQAYPDDLRNNLAMERRRPRAAGKPINLV
jgi:predicted transcriptional regulator